MTQPDKLEELADIIWLRLRENDFTGIETPWGYILKQLRQVQRETEERIETERAVCCVKNERLAKTEYERGKAEGLEQALFDRNRWLPEVIACARQMAKGFEEGIATTAHSGVATQLIELLRRMDARTESEKPADPAVATGDSRSSERSELALPSATEFNDVLFEHFGGDIDRVNFIGLFPKMQSLFANTKAVEPAGWPSDLAIGDAAREKVQKEDNPFMTFVRGALWLQSQAVVPRVERLSDEELLRLAREALGRVEDINVDGMTQAAFRTGYRVCEARIAKHGVPGKASLSHNDLLKTIREWKHHWLQKEPGYEERAFGLDSNMMHHLATLLAKQLGEK
jgi:hypothetical protein